MWVKCKKEISKEVYDTVVENNGYMPDDMKLQVFGICVINGYGLGRYNVYYDEEEKKYMVDYNRGDSCE